MTSSTLAGAHDDRARGAERRSDALRCDIKTSFDPEALLPEEWDGAVCDLDGSLYMTFDWLRIWWEFYGEGKELRLFVYRRGSRIVALLPVYLEDFWIGPVRTAVARLVGANVPPKAFNPPVETEGASEVLEHFLRHLLIEDRCDLVSLGGVGGNWRGAEALRATCDSLASQGFRAQNNQHAVVTIFSLPPRFDDYMESLSSSERKNRRKRLRALEKQHRISTDVVSDPSQVQEEFEGFLKQHSEQWKTEGKGGHFQAWPRGEEFHRALVTSQGSRGRVRFYRLLADGAVIVNRYAFLLNGTLYSELPSRAVGAHWDSLGIGSSSMVKFIESAIADGIQSIDSGLGSYTHKTQLGGQEIPVGTWRVIGNRQDSRRKVALLDVYRRILSIVCGKLWYRRILPRLPSAFSRTQSLRWLRYDF